MHSMLGYFCSGSKQYALHLGGACFFWLSSTWFYFRWSLYFKWSPDCPCDLPRHGDNLLAVCWSRVEFFFFFQVLQQSLCWKLTSISFLWSFLTRWPSLLFRKIFLLPSLMQSLCPLSAFWKVFYDKPMECVVLWSCKQWREVTGTVFSSANWRPKA